jgi:phosphoglycerol transferase MdoB-like AlkP superfamily enzyme
MLQKIRQQLPTHIRLLLKMYVLSLLFFLIIRFTFYALNHSVDVSNVSFFEHFIAFRMGVEFDTVVTCWILFWPVLFFSLAFIFNFKWLFPIGFYPFLGFALLYVFVSVADIPYFNQFGSHLNKNALLWNESPSFVVGMIFGSVYYWGFLFLFIILAFLYFIFSKRFYNTFVNSEKNKLNVWYWRIVASAVLSGIVVIGARGRTSDRSSTHEGLAIVSDNAFLNQVAINPNFTLWKSLFYKSRQSPYQLSESNISQKICFTQNYLGIKDTSLRELKRNVFDSSASSKPYNIVIVLMESMSVYKMGYYGGKNLTPKLHQLNKESIFFDNFFSSGIHTFNGLFSTTSGYPSIFAHKALKSYTKKAFKGIGTLLSERGYDTYFCTTHDPHFDNMQGFFTFNHFKHFICQYDFNFSQAESNLGVPDHLLLDKLIETLNKRTNTQPFLSVLMTASDHGPWKIPTNIDFKPNGETPQENCTLYADWAIGRFIQQAKQQTWYANTVFLFLGDHGVTMGHAYEMPITYNHVPFIIHQPSLFKPDSIHSPCYQPDVPATVMGIIGANYLNEGFGINVLKEKHPYVVFSADDKIGCVSEDGYYFYSTLSNQQHYLRKYKNLDPVNYINIKKNKADSMRKNMMTIYETANYFLKRDYVMFEL